MQDPGLFRGWKRILTLRILRNPPYAFTEHGAVMAASVLNSPRAIAVSVQVVRAYVKLRELLASDKVIKDIALLKQVANLHGKDIGEIKKILNYLIETPEKPERQIGFTTKDDK